MKKNNFDLTNKKYYIIQIFTYIIINKLKIKIIYIVYNLGHIFNIKKKLNLIIMKHFLILITQNSRIHKKLKECLSVLWCVNNTN